MRIDAKETDPSREPGVEVRLRPVPTSALGPLARAASWVAARATHGDPPGVLTTLARHRRLFRYWLPFASSLLRATALPRADVELVILRTAHNSASWYEWAQHVALARAAGLDNAAIVQVTEGPEADGWTERQRALLRATDELHERRVVTDRTWQLLAAELDDNELVELCFVVGHYEMVAMALNSLGVDADESAIEALDPTAAATADALRLSLAQRRR